MRRVLHWLAWITAVLLVLPLLLVVALNTGPGQRLAVALVNRAAGGSIVLHGLHGRFPDKLRLDRIELSDAKGSYAIVTDVTLDWSPWRLLDRDVAIRRLFAARVAVQRLPASAPPAGGGRRGTSESLPLRIELDALQVGRLELATPVLGAAAVLKIEGRAHVAADRRDGEAEATLRRLDFPGTYRVTGRTEGPTLSARIAAQEPAHGLIATLAELPGLGALDVDASLEGPRAAAALRAAVTAGPLRLDARGTIDLNGEAADLDLTASAPAMAPRRDLSWQSVALDAHLHGPFARPEGRGTLRIAGLVAPGATIGRVVADVSGNEGKLTVSASAEGVRVPGPRPDLLATAPLRLRAEADLAALGLPVRFSLSHPLLTLDGTAETAGALRVQAHLNLPDLGPIAAAAGADMEGHAALDLTGAEAPGGAITGTVEGTLGVTGGMAPLPGLLGPSARIGVAASLHGADLTLSRLSLAGQQISLAAHGTLAGEVLDLDWQAALSNLSVVAANVQGTLDGHGHITGRTDDLAVQAALSGEVAAAGVPRGPLRVMLDAKGLPDRPSGRIVAEGTLDGAPLDLDASAALAADGTLRLAIARAGWKSAHAEGAVTLPPHAPVPLGTLTLHMARLDDLSRLLSRRLTGALSAAVDTVAEGGHPVARIRFDLRDAGVPGMATIGMAKLDATVRDPESNPEVAAALDVAGVRAGAIGGGARLSAKGPWSALALRWQAALQGVAGADLRTNGAATLDVSASQAMFSALEADWRGETLRLLAPARIAYADGIRVDRLRLGIRQAELELAGRISPTLDLTAALRNVPADLARAVIPNMRAEGVVNAEARLTGTAARPGGTVRLVASGIHLRGGAAAALPPASLAADAKLAGATADLRLRLTAGRNTISLDGTVPIERMAAMRLRAQGAVDLATFNPLLTASGRRVMGRASLDATVTGTLAAPRAAGALRLAGGDVQDYVLGAHVTDIGALIEAEGDTIRIGRFSARAGDGSIGASGTLGLGGALPVDLTLTARRAKPLASDRLTAIMDADLTLRGALAGALAAGGTVTIDRAEIRIPDKLPASTPVLEVRHSGQPPPPPPAPPPDIALDLTVTAPGQVFVRGRGLFAEAAGRLHIGGTAAAPVPTGGFRLVRGQFNLAGTALQFTSGTVRFEGSGKLDPALHLVASSTSGNIIATLTVSGFASAPKITLSSEPPLPQDEILAQLLFHQSAGSLSPVQLASVAAALAQITGVGGGVFSPLNSVRQELGLDTLTIGGGQDGTGATLEAGRYVARGVYVGAKQAANGNGTQATVQIDLLRGLKLEGDVGTGGATLATGAAAATDPYGTSVGLTYQFRY